MKFYFDVTETFVKTIAVEADNPEQAQTRAENAYNNREFTVGGDHPDNVEFKLVQHAVEECIREGFFAEEELETLPAMRMLSLKERSMYKCHKCGESRSVKYAINGKTYCNRCALVFTKQELLEDLHMEQIEQM